MIVQTHSEHFTNPLYLESGRILEPYDLVYETYGTLNENQDNVILVCHALTGSHHAAGIYEGESKAGWWDKMIGDDKTIDTTKYFVICINTIGSCFGSTGPQSLQYPTSKPYRLKFPVVTISDMVKAQKILLSHLGIHSLEAIIGGSMGGMQALCFAIEYPKFAKKHIILAATHATQPWAIAFNKVARESVIQDPAFQGGFYDLEKLKQDGFNGLSIGRMAGHISYLSPDSMSDKFGRKYVDTDGLYELFGRYEVERYLDYNGQNFINWFDPLSFLYITKAINNFDSSRNYDSLEDSLSNIQSDILLLSFSSDTLFMPHEMKKIYDTLESIDFQHSLIYHDIQSKYGHDAFLVEYDKFAHYIKQELQRV